MPDRPDVLRRQRRTGCQPRNAGGKGRAHIVPAAGQVLRQIVDQGADVLMRRRIDRVRNGRVQPRMRIWISSMR
ncbi:MAG: hypothetical protein LBU76_01955 [Azoarcus sp.]|nr:hypothetical protein [Azoarcus sp.]